MMSIIGCADKSENSIELITVEQELQRINVSIRVLSFGFVILYRLKNTSVRKHGKHGKAIYRKRELNYYSVTFCS